jgi:ABC-type lipoprotein export system ATPase subunit
VQLRERDPLRTRSSDRNGEPVAELRAASKHYGDRIVFGEISARFTPGTFAAVVGRSGTGKTTLLHLLAGLERPTAGDVHVGGRSIAGRSRTELAVLRRTQVGLVTQDPGLVPYLSARENVVLGLQLRGAHDDLDVRADDALAAVGLTHRVEQRASVLSAGERERVAIARALAARTPLLLVDEPTARLDGENAALVAQLLASAAHERGVAVICATHDAAVIELADDVLDLGAQAEAATGAPQRAEPTGARQP